MIKVLALALYGPLAASTRYRLGQYVSGLAKFGIHLEICHFLGDDYLKRRFGGESLHIKAIFNAGIERFIDLCSQHEYDLLIIYGELFPYMPWWMEQALLRKPYIYDFDDAFYLKYRNARRWIASSFLGRKFESVIAGASAITAGNHILEKYATRFNNNTFYLPTVVDTDRYYPHHTSLSDKVFTVGWIGSPTTAPFLSELIEPLSIIGKEGPVRFVVIGGKAPVVPNVTVIEIEWHEQTEVELINTFDVGVMPLPDSEWARGKCAFKLIQYMACAVAVIASPIGANTNVINSKCGFFASTAQDWVQKLRELRDQPYERAEMGRAGMVRVKQHYSLQRNIPVLASVIQQVLEIE